MVSFRTITFAILLQMRIWGRYFIHKSSENPSEQAAEIERATDYRKSLSPISEEALEYSMLQMQTKYSVGHCQGWESHSMVNRLFQESVSDSLPVSDNCAIPWLSGNVHSRMSRFQAGWPGALAYQLLSLTGGNNLPLKLWKLSFQKN